MSNTFNLRAKSNKSPYIGCIKHKAIPSHQKYPDVVRSVLWWKWISNNVKLLKCSFYFLFPTLWYKLSFVLFIIFCYHNNKQNLKSRGKYHARVHFTSFSTTRSCFNSYSFSSSFLFSLLLHVILLLGYISSHLISHSNSLLFDMHSTQLQLNVHY